jgi:hypothetical protein
LRGLDLLADEIGNDSGDVEDEAARWFPLPKANAEQVLTAIARRASERRYDESPLFDEQIEPSKQQTSDPPNARAMRRERRLGVTAASGDEQRIRL